MKNEKLETILEWDHTSRDAKPGHGIVSVGVGNGPFPISTPLLSGTLLRHPSSYFAPCRVATLNDARGVMWRGHGPF